MKSNRLIQKYALVTGATSGIGEAVVKALIENGYRVLATSKTENKLIRLHNKFKSNIDVFKCDFTDAFQIQALIGRIKSHGAELDLIVNVAGIYHDKNKAFYNISFEDYSLIEVMDTLQVGLIAPVMLAHGVVSLMPKGSSIINISGTFESAKGWLPYYLSKKGLENLTIGLAQELEDKGIRVNCISPADTLTPAYEKFFPEYANEDECLMPEEIANTLMQIVENDGMNGEIVEVRRVASSQKLLEANI